MHKMNTRGFNRRMPILWIWVCQKSIVSLHQILEAPHSPKGDDGICERKIINCTL